MNMHYSPEARMSDVLAVLINATNISSEKQQAMVSALRSVERWTGQSLAAMPADIPHLSELFANIHPIAVGITPKTLANVKSLWLKAIATSELVPGVVRNKTRGRPKSPEWARLWNMITRPGHRNSLSRLITWCNREEISPPQVNSQVIAELMAHRQQNSFCRNPYRVHRAIAKTWNRLVDMVPDDGLQKVDVPVSGRRRSRLPIETFPLSFVQDWHGFAAWAHGEDVFADDARPVRLKQSTLDGYFARLHLAAISLVETGVDPSSIRSLADLTTVDALKRILRRRHEVANGQPSYDNIYLAQLLIQIAREWVKVDPEHLVELKRLAKRLPQPVPGMTRKNKLLVTKFDDPVLTKRFLSTPARIWENVQTRAKQGRWLLAEAQAALAIGTLMFVPVRLGNLTALAFDQHLILHEGGTSSLHLSAEETKTGVATSFDIPRQIAEWLIEYRDNIAPEVIGRAPTHLFSNVDGSLKCTAGVRYLVQQYLKSYVGIHMNPHAYRHLAAKFILDDNPGAHVLVQHLLGHKSVETTVKYYAGLDTRRAGRHHHALLDKALAELSASQTTARAADSRRRGRQR